MHKSKLVLIQDDELSQKLIVTWPLVWRTDTEERFEHWERVSGVDRVDVESRQEMLFSNGFLGPEGIIDPEIENFIALLVSIKIHGGPPKKVVRRGG